MNPPCSASAAFVAAAADCSFFPPPSPSEGRWVINRTAMKSGYDDQPTDRVCQLPCGFRGVVIAFYQTQVLLVPPTVGELFLGENCKQILLLGVK